MIIIPMQAKHLKMAAVLFNQYRMFYGQSSDPQAAESFLNQRLMNNESLIFLATNETEEEGMGFMQIYRSFTSIDLGTVSILNDLYVHPQHRKKGIASALLIQARQAALDLGDKEIILQTAVSNSTAQRLYESCGYIKDELFLTYSLPLLGSNS